MQSSSALQPKDLVAILKEDLAALNASLEKGSLPEVVIFGNRFMSNVSLFSAENEGNALLFSGETLRLLGEDLGLVAGRLGQKETIPADLLESATDYVSSIGGALPNIEKEVVGVAKEYYRFRVAVAPHQRTDAEKAAYQGALSLEGHGRVVLEGVLRRNATAVVLTRGRILEGVLNESARLQRVHSFDAKDLCFFMAVKAMTLVNAYYRYLLAPIENEPHPPPQVELAKEQDSMAKSIPDFLDRIDAADDDAAWVATKDFVAPLVKRWREFFVVYMDIPTPTPPVGINITQASTGGQGQTMRGDYVKRRKPKE
jgi:hypothetical protein